MDGDSAKLKVGSLFAGIGGFDLGFTRAGFEIAWQVEIDEWCRKVLEKHFPDAKRYGDIREVGAHNLSDVDVICGGFPCQPFSAAGKRSGTKDDRYLWPEMLRVIHELKPSWVVAENVYGLTAGKMEPIFEQVLSSLEGEGYEVQPFIIPACAVDAPHRRDRVWIVAHCPSSRMEGERISAKRKVQVADVNRRSKDVAHADESGLEERQGIGSDTLQKCQATERDCSTLPDTASERPGEARRGIGRSQERVTGHSWAEQREWQPEPGIRRVANGIPRRVDRLRGLGNAVVPQIPELIGNIILETERWPAETAN